MSPLQKPSEVVHARAVAQLHSRHVAGINVDARAAVAATVVPDPRDLRLVKFWDNSSGAENEDPVTALACEFCPHTGRVVVLWDSLMEGTRQVILYDFHDISSHA